MKKVSRSVGSSGCVATIGVFDGFHLGHRTVVDATLRESRKRGIPSVAVTFAPHPLTVVDPTRAPRMLATIDERIEALRRAGIDRVRVLPFTPSLAATTADQFIADVLLEELSVAAVVVGADFRFGSRNAGTVDTLRQAGSVAGFDVRAVPLVEVAGEKCSSTRIRQLLADGHETAAILLGSPVETSLAAG